MVHKNKDSICAPFLKGLANLNQAYHWGLCIGLTDKFCSSSEAYILLSIKALNRACEREWNSLYC